MRRAVLVLLATSACWRDDAKRTTPETIDNRTATTPTPRPIRDPEPDPTPQPQPIPSVNPQAVRVACTLTNAGITVGVTNRTNHPIDLCKQVDAALTKVNPPARFGGYVVEVELTANTTKQGTVATTGCQVAMNIIAPQPKVGKLQGGGRVTGGANARDIELGVQDCSGAVIEDLLLKKLFP